MIDDFLDVFRLEVSARLLYPMHGISVNHRSTKVYIRVKACPSVYSLL